MTVELIRSFTANLEVRTEGNKREIEGIAVPYGKVQHIYDDLFEEFDHGAFDHQFNALHRIEAALEHVQLGGRVAGKTIHVENTSEGLFWRAKILRLPVGDELLELVREGLRNQLSIGFRARKDRFYRGKVRTYQGEALDNQKVTVRHKADLFEVAVVKQGAYGEAATIGGIRSLTPYGQEPDTDIDLHGDVQDVTVEFEAEQARARKVRTEMLYLEATRTRARMLGIED